MKTVNTKGLRLSAMMLGTVQLGMPYGIANAHGQPVREESFKLLDTARLGGVNCFDTARHYGESEEILGEYFSMHPGHGDTFVTKFKIDPARGTSPTEIAAQLSDYAEQSRCKLGVDSIPIYLAHNADDIRLYGDSVANALLELRERGVIRHAGVSVYEAEQIDAVLKNPLYEAVQLPMNVFDLRLVRSRHLAQLEQAGHLVFVRSVFLQGLFFMQQFPPGFVEAGRYVHRLRELANAEGIGVAQLALCYVRDLPGVTSLVLGAETAAQVEDNIRLMQAPMLSEGLCRQLENLSREIPIHEIMAEILSRK